MNTTALARRIALCLLPGLVPLALSAQLLEPPSTGGAVVLASELRMLGHNERVLVIGAHPDDEDDELLTVLSRKMGAEAAYLSLNRGEGGQNLIGPELGEALGLLRTSELLSAERINGARQYFTRAYDFGYSKTLADTWAHWPRDSVLKDVVRIVRRFRPQVIVTIFTGTPQDGHGQHQASGWAAQEAFRIAGDSARYPELRSEEHLSPWTPQKLYLSTRFDSAATTLAIDSWGLDSAVGRTWHQIAMQSRSQHRSQDMGQLQGLERTQVRLRLLSDRTGRGAGRLFTGVDTTLTAALGAAGAQRYLAAVRQLRPGPQALSEAQWRAALKNAVETLVRSFAAGRDEPGRTGDPAVLDQLRHLWRLTLAREGLLLDGIALDDRLVPGQESSILSLAVNDGLLPLELRADLDAQSAATARADSQPGTRPVPRGQLVTWRFTATVDTGATPSTPYFLRLPRTGDLYQWPAEALAEWGRPFGPAEFSADFALGSGGYQFFPAGRKQVAFRMRDQSWGEVRRPVIIVPRVDVKLDPGSELWPAGDTAAHRFVVTLTHGARDTTTGSVRLLPGQGWQAPPPQPFTLTREDERREFEFFLRLPPGAASGRIELRAVVEDSRGHRYDAGVFVVDYPHIEASAYTRAATAQVTVAALALPRLARVGYVRGAADRVPEALIDVGVPVMLLNHDLLERGDLSRYDAIVVGPRAYETDTALVDNNPRLLEYARQGGVVIVQYQQHFFFSGGFAPYPLTVGGRPLQLVADSLIGAGVAVAGPSISHDRVTDETAPVSVVDSGSPLLTSPNRLGLADWDGWVQERGLYFARSWDTAYHPVFELHDPGEAPLEGGLLVARVGKGTYVYTGLSFFRQLPAGVPGAFRLFANLLALGEQGAGSRER